MFAELVINIEAPLESTFHYHVPRDLQRMLRVGHLVEVEFGQRLAQGVIIAFDDTAPVEETKPIIALIDPEPVLYWWQIELAQWLSQRYLSPLNSCLRLMLPPGLTRWADTTVAMNPYWDGHGRLTDLQAKIIEIVREKGDMRGRQLQQALRKQGEKGDWQIAVNQLARRDILRKATILDPPRIRPKTIRTAELIAAPERWHQRVTTLGRANKQADVLAYLLQSDDPLPAETAVLTATNTTEKQLQELAAAGLIGRSPAQTVTMITDQLPMENGQLVVEQPALVFLTVTPKEALRRLLALRGAQRYYAILALLEKEAQPVNISDIYAKTDTNVTHLKKLEKLGLIRFGAEEVWRDPLADRDFVPAQPPLLTPDQARVWGRIKMQMMGAGEDLGESSPTPFLLHGVTGSGKTEIYMRAIAQALTDGEQAIVLVPEIALTPQTVRRFAARFPGRVAVLHSRLSDGERYDTWRRARQGLFDIIVGPRSALFTPLPNLGVIVLDEEHDPSYKQTPPVPPPYYHARETAVTLAQILNAVLIMGSATPDIVTYHQARGGRYQLLELPRRVMGHRLRIESQADRVQAISHYQHTPDDPDDALSIPLPPVQIVDMRQELRAGNRSIFSRVLNTAVTETLSRGEQAILFLNRRGTNTYVFCRDCGYVARCPRCDMPLTYHRPDMMLVCHHCGRRERSFAECPQCKSKRIKHFGLGTEEVETQVQQRWPEARLTRWDRDTTAGKNTHETLLASFINHESDILVGTQMIAKGLDLPLVTLVGVVSADVSLGLPDYRTGERAFQILAQVAGRAGRGLLGGRVIVQTYQPEHYAIQAAAEHDFASFYIEEIRFRTQHSLPPFRRLARLLYIDPVNERGEREAEKLAQALRLHIREKALGATEILGPTPPYFNRIDGRYRWQLLVRSPDPMRLLEDLPVPRPWLVDIDPVSTL
ncbi:MAG: primosomal protein N' [Chloroflexi bacterium]|nr:primosomal protein N' [Ardenticatenaceae bacterium]MBL1129667.1 primosomal protein N' [Chloroflexota bacterium]NOG35747.1 primosomal protein N' [Chloroflexota bacterium]GIK56425.1 MAG: primosomal protein N' [Chloroflexota bacterium]